jgi:hypothetical protein
MMASAPDPMDERNNSNRRNDGWDVYKKRQRCTIN